MNALTFFPACPSWCSGHTDREAAYTPRHHFSKAVRVGKQDDLLFPYAAAVTLVWWTDEDASRVHVARHRVGGVDNDSTVAMSPKDAKAWADILDGVGADELADAIRRTLALLDDENPAASEQRPPRPGETCACGRPAEVVYITSKGHEAGHCGNPHGAATSDDEEAGQ